MESKPDRFMLSYLSYLKDVRTSASRLKAIEGVAIKEHISEQQYAE